MSKASAFAERVGLGERTDPFINGVYTPPSPIKSKGRRGWIPWSLSDIGNWISEAVVWISSPRWRTDKPLTAHMEEHIKKTETEFMSGTFTGRKASTPVGMLLALAAILAGGALLWYASLLPTLQWVRLVAMLLSSLPFVAKAATAMGIPENIRDSSIQEPPMGQPKIIDIFETPAMQIVLGGMSLFYDMSLRLVWAAISPLRLLFRTTARLEESLFGGASDSPLTVWVRNHFIEPAERAREDVRALAASIPSPYTEDFGAVTSKSAHKAMRKYAELLLRRDHEHLPAFDEPDIKAAMRQIDGRIHLLAYRYGSPQAPGAKEFLETFLHMFFTTSQIIFLSLVAVFYFGSLYDYVFPQTLMLIRLMGPRLILPLLGAAAVIIPWRLSRRLAMSS